jgi:uncharacterized membrane-anchored protein YhcB (DUF1043 family)
VRVACAGRVAGWEAVIALLAWNLDALVGIVIGLFVGVPVGMVILALAVAAGRADRRAEIDLTGVKPIESFGRKRLGA